MYQQCRQRLKMAWFMVILGKDGGEKGGKKKKRDAIGLSTGETCKERREMEGGKEQGEGRRKGAKGQKREKRWETGPRGRAVPGLREPGKLVVKEINQREGFLLSTQTVDTQNVMLQKQACDSDRAPQCPQIRALPQSVLLLDQWFSDLSEHQSQQWAS